jgi:dihydrolipoamide dehydrogenase
VKKFDVVIIGSGPGGYISAIRAAQLGQNVAIVESDNLGGVCLNKGCIPTKALLKSAHSVHEIKTFKELGINLQLNSLDGSQAVKRAKKISKRVSKGISLLMKKNNIEIIYGYARFKDLHTLEINSEEQIYSKFFIIATGAKYKAFPNLQHDGKRLIGAFEAVSMEHLPKSIGIIGAGAIGVEFAYFWNAFGVEVHIFELFPRLLPLEDHDSSLEVQKAYKKYGIKMNLGLQNVIAKNNGNNITITATKNDKETHYTFDMGLIAVGMTGNIKNIGLEKLGISTKNGFISVNEYQQTNIDNIYSIGDVCGPPLLAHVASHEGMIASEHLSNKRPQPLNKMNIPACTYCQPQVASIGYREIDLNEQGIEYKVGKIPFIANAKALANKETSGFVKVLMGKYGELLGAHIVGTNATELIHEYSLFKTMEGIDDNIYATVHPHPTLGEWLSEAVMAAKGRALNF